MQILIDTLQKTVTLEKGFERNVIDLYSKEAFEYISDIWLKASWNQKYSYTFTWLGRPIIQHPEDILRFQEVIYNIKPDIIIETGVAHGGSVILSASLLKLIGKGRVIGIDLDIRPHNRTAIETHELASYVELLEGNSIDPEVIEKIKGNIRREDKVLIILDSNHSKAHVKAELKAYHSLVSSGSYIVATDGLMKDLFDVPRGKLEWQHDNPVAAVEEFLIEHPDFILEPPTWQFNESSLNKNITGWPNAWLRRV